MNTISIPTEQIKVLIVDDTPENVRVAGKILEEDGYDIYIANCGDDAVRLARKHVFDLILLDVMMPVQDGFSTCTQILTLPGYDSVPIIFLSARVDIDSIVKGFNLGAVDYIRKPFNPHELRSRVRTHTELRLYRRELEQKNNELEHALTRIEEIARTDELTGLLNRRELARIFAYESSRSRISGREFAIIMLDIDLFKLINDTFGHIMGDSVLKKISSQLVSSTREHDYISRWGGDEFMILLPEVTTQGAQEIAEQLRKDVEEIDYSDIHGPQQVTVTCGVGLHEPGMPLQILIDHVDKAMLRGKAESRNCVILHVPDTSFRDGLTAEPELEL